MEEPDIRTPESIARSISFYNTFSVRALIATLACIGSAMVGTYFENNAITASGCFFAAVALFASLLGEDRELWFRSYLKERQGD